MKEPKIVVSFARTSDSNLSTKSQFIISSMTGNTNFTTPTPTLAVLTAARTAFDTALAAAQTRDVNKIAVKNDKRELLIVLLRQLANYVELISNGNRTIMLSSGFELAKDGNDSVSLGNINNFTVTEGNNIGQVVSKCEGVENCISYLHCYTLDPVSNASIWTELATSTSSYTFEGLESGKKYWFKLKAVGRKNQLNVSNALSRIVQ